MEKTADEAGRGRQAQQPTQIPRAGWKDILIRTVREAKADQLALLAAGVAFYAMLALFPTLIALVTVYGLVADPAQIETLLQSYTSALPPEAAALLTDQIATTADARRGLTIGLVVSLIAVLWTASGGVNGLIIGINLAYDEEEMRGFVKRRGVALLLTLSAILLVVVVVVLLAVVPIVLNVVGLGREAELAIIALRWPLLAVLVMGALAVLYRYAPDRDRARFTWVSPGALVATLLWLAGSAAFGVYVRNFGRYDQTYGTIGGVIVLLLWLFVSAFAVLFGAELNAETERQTYRDSTRGPAKPLGQRGAYAADTVGPSQ
jgi:membrane protein